MLRNARHSGDAEAHFRDAINIAVRQGARFWELRCATSLARYMIGAGQSANALALLEKVSGSFTEGEEIADIRAARELIAQLRA